MLIRRCSDRFFQSGMLPWRLNPTLCFAFDLLSILSRSSVINKPSTNRRSLEIAIFLRISTIFELKEAAAARSRAAKRPVRYQSSFTRNSYSNRLAQASQSSSRGEFLARSMPLLTSLRPRLGRPRCCFRFCTGFPESAQQFRSAVAPPSAPGRP